MENREQSVHFLYAVHPYLPPESQKSTEVRGGGTDGAAGQALCRKKGKQSVFISKKDTLYDLEQVLFKSAKFFSGFLRRIALDVIGRIRIKKIAEILYACKGFSDFCFLRRDA